MQESCVGGAVTWPRFTLDSCDCKLASLPQSPVCHFLPRVPVNRACIPKEPSAAGGWNNPPLQLSRFTLPPVGRNSLTSSVWGSARLCWQTVLADGERISVLHLVFVGCDHPEVQ